MNRPHIFVVLLLCYALIALLRLTAPSDIDNRDQAKQGLYILDVVQGKSFFLPTQRGTEPATKPPLYNWVAAGISVLWGKVDDLTIRLPSVLCGLGVVFITFLVGELLFSAKVGLLAGLILILNYHFANLCCIARTDMMLCFFISLAFLFFLLAYKQPERRSTYSIIMFVCIGLGSLTKGPVALALVVLTILAFLFFKKDLKCLRSMHLGWGMLIWFAIMLGWFIPALIEGGRQFFDIVVYDEMVNRFLGVGTRAEKTRPFYYLVGHFFGKFLPWSLFVPSAIARYWKSRHDTEENGLLFPLVWFATVLIFFSVSRGKRSDYILPLYPAASVIVAHFWLSLFEQREFDRWGGRHLQMLSLGYLAVCLLIVAGMITVLIEPETVRALLRIVRASTRQVELLHHTLGGRTGIFLLAGLPLAAVSFLGIVLALRRKLKALLIVMLVAAGLQLSLYFEIMSPKAMRLSGEQKQAFCEKAAAKITSTDNLEFRKVRNSILFYMGKNTSFLTTDEVLEHFRETDDPYLITTKRDYLSLQTIAEFEFEVLEESGYLIKEKRIYVLLGKKRPAVGVVPMATPDGSR